MRSKENDIKFKVPTSLLIREIVTINGQEVMDRVVERDVRSTPWFDDWFVDISENWFVCILKKLVNKLTNTKK